METKDLMIGNFVLTPAYNNMQIIIATVPRKIKGINSFGVLDFSNPEQNVIFYAKHCIPIPLTEKILIDSGFELYHENDFGRQYVLKIEPKWFYVVINERKNTFAIHSDFTAINNIPCKETGFVHNLQNAYRLATGEDLEIGINA